MDSTPAPTPPSPTKFKWILLVGGLLLALSLLKTLDLIGSKRPQLDLTNTGTNSVTVVLGKYPHDVLPGNTYHARIKAGDTITFRPPAAAPGGGLTVTLETRTLKGGSPPRVAAEVNADVPSKIRFEYK